MREKLYYLGWPSFLGGADTKIAHLLDLLCLHFEITVIPNWPGQLDDKYWCNYLKIRNIKCCLIDELPSKIDGIALSMCNREFLNDKKYEILKDKGLKIIWSSEMMWHFDGELKAIQEGYIDKILYVSEIQRNKLNYPKDLPFSITGNYINPRFFPFIEREIKKTTVIGRLSRHDPAKYPEDFPVFYELLEIPNVKFRVMGWSEDLADKYNWHNFDDRWDLLFSTKETQVDFLHSLDLFVYPLGHTFIESWGRSTVEAMLTGCIPFVQSGHNLENFIIHGKTGFICDDINEYKENINMIIKDSSLKEKLSINCSKHAIENICNEEEHLNIWKEALNV